MSDQLLCDLMLAVLLKFANKLAWTIWIYAGYKTVHSGSTVYR